MCVVSHEDLGETDYPYILVESTGQALLDIAKLYRDSFDVKVVGITGSVGKTSTKEMIASVLSQKYNVHKTLGNFNNEWGLPITIFEMNEENQVAILEMGVNHFGEMLQTFFCCKSGCMCDHEHRCCPLGIFQDKRRYLPGEIPDDPGYEKWRNHHFQRR